MEALAVFDYGPASGGDPATAMRVFAEARNCTWRVPSIMLLGIAAVDL